MSNDLERRTTINESTANHSADEAAIHDLYRELMDGWCRDTSDAFAAAFAEDGDLIGSDGTHFHGRKEIAPETPSGRSARKNRSPIFSEAFVSVSGFKASAFSSAARVPLFRSFSATNRS
jgi:hypothetical protein